jgi:spermidine synthase
MYPILVDTRPGEINPCLEVRISNGQYMLDSLTVNYSYGGARKLFDSFFKKIKIKSYDFNNVLLLGMGAGSVISLLTEKYGKTCQLTAVERDTVVIDLAKKYFDLQRFNSLRVVKDDAFKFVAEEKEKYDLIIVDLFVDTEVPKQFGSTEFISNLRKIATNDCCIIYNRITDKPTHKKELEDLMLEFVKFFSGTEIHKLICNGTENSFIYYNTLPSFIQEIKTVNIKSIKQDVFLQNLKPALTFDKDKSKN